MLVTPTPRPASIAFKMWSQSGGNLRLLMNAIATSQKLTAFSWCSQRVFAFNVELVESISSFTCWMFVDNAYELSSIGNFMVVQCFFLFMENTDCFRQLVFQPLQLFHFIFFKLTIGVTCYTHDVASEWAIFGINLDFTVYIHNVFPLFLCVCFLTK